MFFDIILFAYYHLWTWNHQSIIPEYYLDEEKNRKNDGIIFFVSMLEAIIFSFVPTSSVHCFSKFIIFIVSSILWYGRKRNCWYRYCTLFLIRGTQRAKLCYSYYIHLSQRYLLCSQCIYFHFILTFLCDATPYAFTFLLCTEYFCGSLFYF